MQCHDVITTERNMAARAIKPLKTIVFFGSAKTKAAPWGGDVRLGDRVLKHVLKALEARGNHEVTVYDPVKVFGAGGGLENDGELQSPHFFYAPGTAPAPMDAMRDEIKAADCFLIVSPEYNHSVPPALSSMMGHFGGSNYANKVSGIVTYSPSPFGGMRAAMAIKIMCSELGCCPISKLAGIGTVSEVLNEDGTPKLIDGHPSRILSQIPKLLVDLEWWADATRTARESHGPPVYE
eukprot:m.175378 g.175378  ORF g.175378 m.175378 type:complete len:237 (+) comp13983_c0_seq1:52-762(+)